jgi:hypothetical protein
MLDAMPRCFSIAATLEQMIDLFGEARLALNERLQRIELPVDFTDLVSDVSKALIDTYESRLDSIDARLDMIEALMYPLEFVQYDPTKSLKIGFGHSWKYIMIKCTHRTPSSFTYAQAAVRTANPGV